MFDFMSCPLCSVPIGDRERHLAFAHQYQEEPVMLLDIKEMDSGETDDAT